MHLTLFGTGYVGLVTRTCLAGAGYNVLCIDVDEAKIERLRAVEIPNYESGLEAVAVAVVESSVAAGTLSFTFDAREAVAHAELQIIAVGTPDDGDGAADLSYVLDVWSMISRHMNQHKIVIVKLKVPVGTCGVAAVPRTGFRRDGSAAETPRPFSTGATSTPRSGSAMMTGPISASAVHRSFRNQRPPGRPHESTHHVLSQRVGEHPPAQNERRLGQ